MPAAVAATASHPPRRRARDVAASILLVLFRLGTDAVLYSWMAAIWGGLFCGFALEILTLSIFREGSAVTQAAVSGGFAVAVRLAPVAVPLILIRAYEHFCVDCEEAERMRMGKLCFEVAPERLKGTLQREISEPASIIATVVASANEKLPERMGAWTLLPSGDSLTVFIRKYQLHAAILILSYGLLQHAVRFQLEERSIGWRVGFIFCDIAAWGSVIIGSFFNIVREMAIQVPLPRAKYQL